MRGTTWSARLGVLFAALALLGVFVPSAVAQEEPGGHGQGGHGVGGQGGQSTPGVIVTAQNPGTSPGSSLRITLTAHSERSTVQSPDCRPATENRPPPNLRCWGSLVLQIPDAGGLSVAGPFEVHRVAVGDISCGGCEEGEAHEAAEAVEREQAQVNGVGALTDPGDTGLPVGTLVQVQITLMDYGTAQYTDTAYVVVNEFAQGSDKPNLYTPTQAQTIQQVRVQYLGNTSG